MSESQRHIVFPKNWQCGSLDIWIFENYAEAFDWWKAMNDPINDPLLIAVVGRVIDPSVPVIDPSE